MTVKKDPRPVTDVEAFKRIVSVTLTVDASTGNYSAGMVVGDNDGAGLGTAKAVQIGLHRDELVEVREVIAVCNEDSVLNRLRLHFFNYSPAAADVEMDDQGT